MNSKATQTRLKSELPFTAQNARRGISNLLHHQKPYASSQGPSLHSPITRIPLCLQFQVLPVGPRWSPSSLYRNHLLPASKHNPLPPLRLLLLSMLPEPATLSLSMHSITNKAYSLHSSASHLSPDHSLAIKPPDNTSCHILSPAINSASKSC